MGVAWSRTKYALRFRVDRTLLTAFHFVIGHTYTWAVLIHADEFVVGFGFERVFFGAAFLLLSCVLFFVCVCVWWPLSVWSLLSFSIPN